MNPDGLNSAGKPELDLTWTRFFSAVPLLRMKIASAFFISEISQSISCCSSSGLVAADSRAAAETTRSQLTSPHLQAHFTSAVDRGLVSSTAPDPEDHLGQPLAKLDSSIPCSDVLAQLLVLLEHRFHFSPKSGSRTTRLSSAFRFIERESKIEPIVD
jgi:hypothetical protein